MKHHAGPKPRMHRRPKGPAPLLSPGNIMKAVGGYLGFLFFSYAFSSAAWRCPAELECDKGVQGYFWDASWSSSSAKGGSNKGKGSRAGGHLLERDVGLGVLAQESCAKLCQDVPDCAYWMYTKTKKTGTCKLWAADQSPCKPLSTLFIYPFPTVRFTSRGKAARSSVVGGPCRQEESDEVVEIKPEEKKERLLLHGDLNDIDFSKLETTECPHLECAAPEKGFLFDHKSKGHLKSMVLKLRKRRGYTCYMHCRDTPGCSIWMIDENDDDGECKMWTKEQSPCEPTDPYDATTAHYVPEIPGRAFLIGGNCHKLTPRPPKKDRDAAAKAHRKKWDKK